MKRLIGFCTAALITLGILLAPSSAQISGFVTWKPPVTAGDCTKWLKPGIVEDAGACGGGSMVYPGAGVANSTGSAWGTSYTTTGSGTVIPLQTSPTLVTPILTGYATASLPTCNSSSKGSLAYTTDGTPAFTFCNGSTWTSTGGTTFTVAGTGCTPTAVTGDATGGSFVLGTGPCTSVTVTFNGAVGMTAPHLWVCSNSDQTLQRGVGAPTANTPTTSTTGGTLAAATYYYVITATNAYGEALNSNEVSVTTTGTTSSNTITWATVTGATGYRVYRGTAAAGENTYYAVSGGSTATFTDTGAAGTAASPPASNTTTAWFGTWGQSSSTTTSAVIPIPAAAGPDLITFNCSPH